MFCKNLKNRLIKDKVEPYVYLLPFMLFLIVFTIYPVINVFILSFKENYSYLRGTFDGWSLENYKEVLTDDKLELKDIDGNVLESEAVC